MGKSPKPNLDDETVRIARDIAEHATKAARRNEDRQNKREAKEPHKVRE